MAMLQYGSNGMFVRDIQGLLWQAGLYNGAIDGYYGRQTEKAVQDWQQEIGAVVDGAWGSETTTKSALFLSDLNKFDSVKPESSPVVPYFGGRK